GCASRRSAGRPAVRAARCRSTAWRRAPRPRPSWPRPADCYGFACKVSQFTTSLAFGRRVEFIRPRLQKANKFGPTDCHPTERAQSARPIFRGAEFIRPISQAERVRPYKLLRLDLTPLLVQPLVRHRHLRPELLRPERDAVFLQHPAVLDQLWIALAFLLVLLQPGLVLLPITRQLAGPYPITLQLGADLLEALLDGLQIARVFPEPLRRCFADEAGIDEIAELRLDIVERHRLGQVDAALEAFLQAVPVLEDVQHQARQAFGVGGPVATLFLGQRGQGGAVARQRGFAIENA